MMERPDTFHRIYKFYPDTDSVLEAVKDRIEYDNRQIVGVFGPLKTREGLGYGYIFTIPRITTLKVESV